MMLAAPKGQRGLTKALTATFPERTIPVTRPAERHRMYLKGEKIDGLPIARILPVPQGAAPSVFLVEHVGYNGGDARAWVVAADERSAAHGIRGFLRFRTNDGNQ